MEELTAKLAVSVDAVLSISDADLAEAIEAYSHVGRDGRLGAMAAEEDEDMFACRAALLRLHHLQLLTKAPADAPQLYLSLHKLLQVCCKTCLPICHGQTWDAACLLSTFFDHMHSAHI